MRTILSFETKFKVLQKFKAGKGPEPMRTKTYFNFNRCMKALACTTGVLMAISAPAQAQLGQQTGIADPGRIQEQFREERLLPQVGPRVDVKEMKLLGAPEGSENIKFNFGGVRFSGVSVYTDAQLAALYQSQIGTEISLADLYAIANAVTLKYRNDGYILTRAVVPPQTIEDGIARLQIVEGYIDNVIIQAGDDEPSTALDTIRAYASSISTGGPMNAQDMERGLLLINDLPGVSARSVLSPSRTQPGAADLLVIVERDPYDALIAADNFGSRYLGPVQFTGAGTLNSRMGNNEAVTGQFVIAPDSGYELAYGALSYEQPVGPWGTRVSVSGSLTDTKPGYDLDQFDVRGHSLLMTVQATHPFIRSRAVNLTGRALFDWRDVESQNNIEPTRKDRIRAVRVGGRYEFLDTLLNVAINALDVQISQGLNIFGSSDKGDAGLTRAAGDPNFTKLNAEFQRLQRVTDKVNILLAGRGQWSSNALLSSEEFGVGGVNIGRAYDPSEIVGDDGIAGKVEVQWTNPLESDWEYLEEYQLYTFYDAGRVWNEDATTSADKRNSATSAGLGVRANLVKDVETGLAIAFPLNRDVQTQGDDDPRVYFNLSKRF